MCPKEEAQILLVTKRPSCTTAARLIIPSEALDQDKQPIGSILYQLGSGIGPTNVDGKRRDRCMLGR